ncbi:MAG TPA: hypothetical protein VEY67_01250 [Candidatus Dormibacteraeota bacterium]|nr:hypothetical protein [Candidatus Dormibacteraeota bacterium]
MDGVEVLAFLTFILVLGVVGLIAAIVRGRLSGGASRVAAWLALTALCMWAVFGIAFIVDYGVLFTLGEEVAAVALAASGVALLLTPVATGIFVRRLPHAGR